MTTFVREDFINSVKNVINRVSNMKDKIKALKILDNFQDKTDNDYYIFVFGDDKLWDIYMDVIHEWQEIRGRMTQKAVEVYGDSLPDEMLNSDWLKNTNELLQKRMKESEEAIKNNIIFE